ncbi:hypothetical protein FJZ36_15145 [Candidatus Poribacteria bacterium]|nr:hypothetical protein [Candidatus Poribacteria bacterium]
MRFGQKLAYMALGGMLVLAGYALSGLVVQKAAAQGEGKSSAEFDTVTVRNLDVVDRERKVRVRLRVTPTGTLAWPVDNVLQVFNGAGVSVYDVGASPYGGGIVRLRGNDGEPRVVIRVAPEGGVVETLAKPRDEW